MAIPNPVPGGTFSDTFGAPRSGGRRHAGVDIFAKEGTPIYSPVAGKVAKVGNAGLGGNAVWVIGDDGRAYYFAHLKNFTTAVGRAVSVGTQLGTVGKTGNAEHSSPHLHFSINGQVGKENPVVNPFTVIDKAMHFVGGATDWAGNPIGGAAGSLVDAHGNPVTSDPGSSDAGGVCKGCLIKFPGVASVGDFCILSRCQGRAVVGALALASGGLLMLSGALVLAAYSIRATGAASALRAVPGVGAVASAVTPSGRRASAEAQEVADVRAAERSARMTSAQNRQEAAERRMIARRQTSTPGPRAVA